MKAIGLLFNRKSGQVVKAIEGSVALLKMFAMNNVSASRDYIIVDEAGYCQGYFEGRKNDMPKICNDMVGKRAEDFGFSVDDLF